MKKLLLFLTVSLFWTGVAQPIPQTTAATRWWLLSTNMMDGVKRLAFQCDTIDQMLNLPIGTVSTDSKAGPTNVIVNGYYTAGDGGGGLFWAQREFLPTTTNLGTVFRSLVNTNLLWHRNYHPPLNIKWFGARGGGFDCLSAITNALSIEPSIYVPDGTFTISGQIVINQQSIIGNNKMTSILTTPTPGLQFLRMEGNNNVVKYISLFGSGTAFRNYDPVQFNAASHSTLEDVYIYGGSNCVEMTAGSFYNNVKHVELYNVQKVGFLMQNNANNNTIDFSLIHGGGSIVAGAVGIHSVNGVVNTFGGGEVEYVETGIRDDIGLNYYHDMYIEQVNTNITVTSGVIDINQVIMPTTQTTLVLPNCMIRNGVQGNTRLWKYEPTKASLSSAKGLYLFTEGSGSKVTDMSGNGNDGTLSGGYSWVSGYAGNAVELVNGTSGLMTLPNGTIDPTQAWTFMCLRKHVAGSDEKVIFIGDTSGNYFHDNPQGSYHRVTTWNGSALYQQSLDAVSQASGWAWTAFAFDPVAKTITGFDSFYGVETYPLTNTVTATVNSIVINSAYGGGVGTADYAFIGLWQRAFDFTEYLQLQQDFSTIQFTKGMASPAVSAATTLDPNASSFLGGLLVDGVSGSYQNVVSTLGAQSTVGNEDLSVRVQCTLPASSISQTLWWLGPSTSASTTQSGNLSLETSGDDVVAILRGSAATNYLKWTYSGLRSIYAGNMVDFVLTRQATNLTLYVNGVAKTAVLTSAGDGSTVGSTTITSTYFVLGNESVAKLPVSYYAAQVYNCALPSSDVVLIHNLGLPVKYRWGSMTAVYAANWSAGSDGWGSASVAYDVPVTQAGQANALEVYADATLTTSHATYKTISPANYGRTYRFSGKYYIPSGQTHVVKFRIESANDNTVLGTCSALDIWTNVTVLRTFFTSFDGAQLRLQNAGGTAYSGANSTSDDRIYLYGWNYYYAGAILDLDLTAGYGYSVPDRSPNKLNGTLTAYGVMPIYPKVQVPTGTVTLTNGQATVYTTALDANSIVFATIQNPSGTFGGISVTNKINATSFELRSSSATDTSVVGWWIVEHQ